MHKPRTKIRKGNYPYIFKEFSDITHQTDWRLSEPFVSEWLEISVSGLITVKAGANGYAWDGCTPKISVLNLFVLGVPDGHIDHRTMKPFTYKASMIHDALYQYLDSVPVPKAKIDLLFKDMLGDFKLAWLYYWCVKHFGGRGVKQRGV